MEAETGRLLPSVLALLGGHIGPALRELGVTIERATTGPSDMIRRVVQSDHR
jgi:hypothetical protein